MVEMNRILKIFREDGKIEKMKVVNEYHAQNVLSLLFAVGDKNAENNIVFAELLGSKIFAWKSKGEIVIRNATEVFLNQCREMKKLED